MPGDTCVRRGAAVSRLTGTRPRTLLPTTAVARRVGQVLRAHGCDRVVFGASAPLGLLAPALRRAGAERIVALTHGHEVWWARLPPAAAPAAPDRRLGRCDDLRQRVVPRPASRRPCPPTPLPGWPALARRRPRSVPPGCGGARVRADSASRRRPVVVCTARMVQAEGAGHARSRAWPEVLRSGCRTPGCCWSAMARTGATLERLAARLGVARLGGASPARSPGSGMPRPHRRRRRLRDAVPHPAPGTGAGGVRHRLPRGRAPAGCRLSWAAPAARRRRSSTGRPAGSWTVRCR